MCTKDDFLDWSDVDLHLDAVLASDYTDGGIGSRNNSSTSTSSGTDCYMDGGERIPAKTSKPKTLAGLTYICPVCNKELHSAGGFRGHVLKQQLNFNRSGFTGKIVFILFAVAG